MKATKLQVYVKAAWQNNRPFVLLVSGLLTILSVLKIIFYNYNYHFIFNSTADVIGWKDKINIIKWSLLNDIVIVLLLNSPLLLLLQAARFFTVKVTWLMIIPVFVFLNSIIILLNFSDIFYFPFHFQRANADLLFVADNAVRQLLHFPVLLIIVFLLVIIGIFFLVWRLFRKFYNTYLSGQHCIHFTILVSVFIIVAAFNINSLGKWLVPTNPLVELNSKELIIVQNSAQTFVYSLFRDGQQVNIKTYMPDAACDSIFPIRKTVQPYRNDSIKKNIVLFIMESVPYDFFDTGSIYKVAMPFFDSILKKSIFFNNAFCYSHQSNKGITAILAGIPTISDIPVYHSSYINLEVTPIGNALKKNDYHSFFCIGDDYDNFGFAKCCNWLGIENYFSKENIPGYKQLPKHTMGLHDEYVLNFMHDRINHTAAPFFAVNFNISTHYPYDLPKGFIKEFPANYTMPMKSMMYYDNSLQTFFKAAENESWFSNTVFIFCSDHWLVPDDNKINFNAITGYRIPIIIYDPAVSKGEVKTQLASQFDIMNTILSIGGYKDSIISYGNNLFDNTIKNSVVFSRANASLYQVTDSNYILGFNISNNKAEFFYNYKTDPALQHNLINEQSVAPRLAKLILTMKAFIQKATLHYNRVAFK